MPATSSNSAVGPTPMVLMIVTVIFSFTQVPLMMKYAKTDQPPPPHVE